MFPADSGGANTRDYVEIKPKGVTIADGWVQVAIGNKISGPDHCQEKLVIPDTHKYAQNYLNLATHALLNGSTSLQVGVSLSGCVTKHEWYIIETLILLH